MLPQLVSAPQQPVQAPPLVMAATPGTPAPAMPTLNALQPQAQAPALVLAPVPKTPASIAQPLTAPEVSRPVPALVAAPALKTPAPIGPQLNVPQPTQPPALVTASKPTEKAEQSQQRINSAVTSLSPKRPDAVPRGGLLASIQNNSQTQNKGTHVENVNIHTGKPMNPLELEGMLAMAVGG